jgi:uncharacterized protein YndB with AHSA1/START domain
MTDQQQTHRLTVTAEGDREIVTERVFDAPRERVFKAVVDPELVRVGGEWRFVSEGPDGSHAFYGTYRAIDPPEKLEQTFEWEGMPGHVVVERAEFEDLGGGRTKVTTHSLFQTTEERDGMLASGMESGQAESYERLDELLAASQRA